MKKHSMLKGAALLWLTNIYGIVLSSLFKPTPYVLLVSSILLFSLVLVV